MPSKQPFRGHVQREGIVVHLIAHVVEDMSHYLSDLGHPMDDAVAPSRRRTTRAASTSYHASAQPGKTAGSKSGLTLMQIAKHEPEPLPCYAQINAGRVVSKISELGLLVQMGSVLSIRRSCDSWRSSKSANHLRDEPPKWASQFPFF